jgi:hypothetical protein
VDLDPVTVTTAEQNWLARSTGAGVVWAHDFTSDPGAVAKYLFLNTAANSNAANLTTLDTTDGILGGGCLKERVPAGQRQNNAWERPFSAFPGDRGYVGSDVREYKTILTQDCSNNTYYYRRGLYGHTDYAASTKNASAPTTQWEWKTHSGSLYIQFRCKISASYFSQSLVANEGRGKFLYIDLTGGGAGELTLVAPYGATYWGNPASTLNKRYSAYTNWGYGFLYTGDGKHQPGGAWDTTCLYGSAVNTCWEFPVDQWFTMLLHIVPGHQNAGADSSTSWMAGAANKDTQVIVYAHRQGETGYTKITEQLAFPWWWNATYESGAGYGVGPAAFNAFNIRPYMGASNQVSEVEWTRKWDQIIFSTQPIACPNDGVG